MRAYTRKDFNLDFPLRGFALCDECKEPYTASYSTGRHKKYPYYRCTTKGCIERNKSIARSLLEEQFEATLRRIQPKQEALALTKAVLLDVWTTRRKNAEGLRSEYQSALKKNQEEMDRFLRLIAKSSSDKAIKVYEQEIEKLSAREQALLEKIETPSPLFKIDFGTALDRVFAVLENPLNYWLKDDLSDKKLVLKLVFTGPVAYNRNSGFGTANLALPLRVFELSTLENSQFVEMGGIEPPCKREK
jgi:site-specific DNA recombinase